MNTEALYLAEIEGYDKALGATRIIRVATRPFTTRPSESPANTVYDVCLTQPADIERSLFGSAATRGRSTMALGSLTLSNPDKALDYLNALAFDTRTVTVYRTTKFNPSFPADFTSFIATMEQPEWDTSSITFKLRDRFYTVASAPLQTTKYLGNNALPNGLEGTSELAGKAKPVCFGVVESVPALPINTDKLIYQVNDGAVASVDAVYDRGVPLVQAHAWSSAGAVGSGSFTLVRLTYGNGIWVRTNGGTGTIHTSPDGVTWTLKYTVSGGSPQTRKAIYANGQWLVFGADGGGPVVLHSTDNFTTVTKSNLPTTMTAGFYHAAESLWVGIAGATIYTSPDGATWTLQYTDPGSPGLVDGEYRAGVGVIIGNGDASQGVVYSSVDGLNWVKRLADFAGTDATGALSRVIAGPDQFVAIGRFSSAISLDGITWQRAPLPLGNSLAAPALVWMAELYLAPAQTGGFFVSADGLSWELSTDGYVGTAASLVEAMASDGNNLIVSDSARVIWYTTPDVYASQSDLLDDTRAPLLFHYRAYPAGGMFRLGGTPDGLVVCDATEGATAGHRTAAGIAARVLARVPGAPTFVSSDLTALDALDSSPCGYWTADDGVTCDTVLDFIVGTPGASWFPDKLGRFRVAQFAAPSGTPVLTIRKDDILRDSLKRVSSNDPGNGIPFYQIVIQYRRFYQTMTTDIAGVVDDAARADFAQEWRNVTSTSLAVLTTHPSASVLTIPSAYANKAAAQVECDRQGALRSVKRDTLELTVPLNDETDALELNDVIEIVHDRFSLGVVSSQSGYLEGGGLFRILDAHPNAEQKELTLTVWGGARYQNIIDKHGAYLLDKNGAFVIARIPA